MDEKLIEDDNLYDVEVKKTFPKFLIYVVILLFLIIGLLFLYKNNKVNEKRLKKLMKDYSIDYFEKNMSINDISNEYIVTLRMLEDSNDYDLKNFKGCKKQSTFVMIKKNPYKVKVELNC